MDASRHHRVRRLLATVQATLLLGALAACSGPARPLTSPRNVATTDRPPATASPTTTATTPKSGPPYMVEQTTVPLVDPTRPTVSRGSAISPVRTLTTLVWLPAAPGRWPLVVFGPGFESSPQTYAPLLETWAAHGYVVASPEFPLTDPAVAGPNLDENDINNQPTDLRFVTDALVAPTSPVVADVNPARVGVAGHSDGGESALAASVAPTPAGEPRYRAVIAMAVQPLSGAGAMANPPILVTQGDVDSINPPALGLQTWQQAAGPKYFLDIHGAGHLPPFEADSPWWPGIEAASEAFLDAYVAGDGSPSGVAAAVSNFPVLSLQSG